MSAAAPGRVFVSGLGVVSAAGIGVEALRAAADEGRDCLRSWQGGGLPALRCGVVPGLDREAPAESLALIALADARLPPLPTGTGLIYATTTGGLAGLWERARAAGQDPGPRGTRQGPLIALREATRCAGPSLCVSTACASGLVALQVAARWIQAGRAPAVVVVASDALSPFLAAGFRGLGALSPRGIARPFHPDRDGLVLGEAGVVLLVEGDRAAPRALAELRGFGLRADAHDLVRPDPRGRGLASAARRALQQAGWAPAAVELVSAHGTATSANDAMEREALDAVFGQLPPIRAIKGLVGHTMGAASALETALEVAALAAGAGPRRTLKLSAAFGGVNAALALGDPHEAPPTPEADPPLQLSREAELCAPVEAEARPDSWERAVRALTRGLGAAQEPSRAAPAEALATVLCSQTGCKLADERYFDRLLAEGPDRISRQDFARTVPGAALVPVQVAQGWRGPTLALLGPPEEGAWLAADGLEPGVEQALLITGEVVGAQVRLQGRLFRRPPRRGPRESTRSTGPGDGDR